MNSELSQAQQDQLRELIDALLDGRADVAQQQQLDELLAASNHAVEYYASYIDLHATLRWQRRGEDSSAARLPEIQAVTAGLSTVPRRQRLSQRNAWVSLVTLSIVASVVLLQVFNGRDQAPITSFWRVQPVGDADYVITNDSVKLTRGEIHVRSIPEFAALEIRPIVIETPVGNAKARGTEFFIGTHDRFQGKGLAVGQLTRVLILSGAVTLANDVGSIDGGPHELLAAERNTQPSRIAVDSNSEFAIDMYRNLCSQHAGKNVFFSPYSLHVALTMALEGARGDTAAEIGSALKYPPEVRQIGADRQSIPWRVALMHTGHAAIAARFERRETDAEQTLRKQIAQLQLELVKKNASVKLLATFKQRTAARKAEREAQKLADQINNQNMKLNSLELKIANSLWGDQRYPFRSEFANAVDEHYGTGGIFPADFENSFATERSRINKWVSEHTAGKINDILPPLDPTTVQNLRLIVVNAIYFKGDWMKPFEAERTRPRDFAIEDSREIKVPTMAAYGYKLAGYGAVNSDGSWFVTPKTRILGVPLREQKDLYPEEGFQILSMPYRGDSISMIFILPREGQDLSKLRTVLTTARLAEWVQKLQQRDVHIRLPRFSLSTDYNMIPMLQTMGVKRAFVPATEPDGADLSGMCQSDDPRWRMHISQIIHRATVEVNENGTVASAASAVMTKDAEAAASKVKRVPFTPSFYALRPFVLLIRDMQQGTILFMGHVNDPSSKASP